MPCPNWKECFGEDCFKEKVCMGDYWAKHWIEKKASTPYFKSTSKKRKKERRDALKEPCLKLQGRCDKHRTCEILGQCIVTLPIMKEKPHLIHLIKGKHSVGEIIKIFREHHPKPMRSYYLIGKKKKDANNRKAN